MSLRGKNYSPEEQAELERLCGQLSEIFARASYGEDIVKAARIIGEISQCAYLPLWDTKRNALTTYLCLPPAHAPQQKLSRQGRMTMDLGMLGSAIAELEKLGRDGKKFFIVCPVRHETLYNQDSYKKYHMLCQGVAQEQRKFLILLMTHLQRDLPKTQAYWFVATLKNYCQQIFAEVPLGQKTDFLSLRNAGIDAVGVSIGGRDGSEQETIRLLNSFSAQARTGRIPAMFALEVPTLSLATSAVCAGFDCLAGSAIHGAVKNPDNIYRYRHEDLFAGLFERGLP